jgi:hypothetical protein
MARNRADAYIGMNATSQPHTDTTTLEAPGAERARSGAPKPTSPQENAMSQPYKPSPRSHAAGLAAASTLAMIVALAVPASAHADALAVAEYRCSTPGLLTIWERRACDLARQDSPDGLIHFIRSINMIGAGLNIYAYVSDADGRRWDVASQKARVEPLGRADANSLAQVTEKAN